MNGRRVAQVAPLILVVLAAIIIPFVLFGDQIETATLAWSETAATWGLAAGAVLLLALDVLLPVPSSVVSLLAGQTLGPVLAAVIIWLGMTLGCLVGFLVGRGLLKPLASFMRADASPGSGDWGWLALVLSRPVPVLAEASVLLAAARGAPFWPLMGVTALANIPVAVLYGYAGSRLLDEVPVWVMLGVLAVLSAPMGWWQFRHRPSRPSH